MPKSLDVFIGRRLDQARNKRSSIFVAYKGVTKPLIGWAEELGMDYKLLHRRYAKGWPPLRLFAPPWGG